METNTTAGHDQQSQIGGHAVIGPLERTARAGAQHGLAERLADVQSLLAGELIALEMNIATAANSGGDLANRAAAQLLNNPGKRIRPICVFLAAKVGGGATSDILNHLALAVELAHAATLLHDDVIDLGTERRGQPTARLIYGNPASILGGDYLLVEGLRHVRQGGSLLLLDKFLTVISDMVAAEAIQLEARGSLVPDPARYDAVVKGKTAALFRWALEAGAIVSGLDDKSVSALGRVGEALGMAFQLVDDVLDVSGETGVIGKDSLIDIKEGKLTWPLIIACQRDESLINELRIVSDNPELLNINGRGQELRERIIQSGGVEATRERALHFSKQVLTELAQLPGGIAIEALKTVSQVVIQRAL